MSKKIEKLLNEFRKLDLPDGKYAIYGSGPLGIRELRGINDLDVIVTDDLYQELKEKYPEDSKKKRIKISEIEIYPLSAWGPKFDGLKSTIQRAEIIRGLRFVCLKDLLEWKKKMDRPKDFKDIKLIKNYFKNKKTNPK